MCISWAGGGSGACSSRPEGARARTAPARELPRLPGHGTSWRELEITDGRDWYAAAERAFLDLRALCSSVFVAGVFLTDTTSIEKDVAARPGQQFELRGYDFRFDGVQPHPGPNYRADRGTVVVSRGGREVAVLHPEKRAYAGGGQVMTEAALDGAVHRDLYVALGEPLDQDGTWALRLYLKPFIRLIWLGALLMALGGFTVALDKRFRRPVAAGTAGAAA